MIGSEQAKALHLEHPPIDLHADTLMWSRWLGYDLHARHEPPLWRSAFGGHIDVPRMKEGGIGAQFFSLVSLPIAKRSRGLARAVEEQIEILTVAAERRPAGLRIVKTASEIEKCRSEGLVAALLGIEGAHALEGDLARLERFARAGVRQRGRASGVRPRAPRRSGPDGMGLRPRPLLRRPRRAG
jgi:membrane dipeptidase